MSNEPKIEIALAANDRVFDGLFVSACSIARFADKTARLSFNILDGGVTDSHYATLTEKVLQLHPRSDFKRFFVKESDFDDFPEFHGCKMTYARLLLPSLLPEASHVIYCDTDFLWISDISQLWSQRDAVHSIISARDNIEATERHERNWCTRNGLTYPSNRYFCAGLSFFNLDFFRREHTIDKLNNFIRSHPDLLLPDQTALNLILADSSKLVDDRWQVIPRFVDDSIFDQPVTLHYAGENPWKITFVSKMLTDTQLLWFRFDATLRGCSVWQSLRRYYSAPQIVFARLLFFSIMSTRLSRHLFDRLMIKLNRGRFRETISRPSYRKLWKMLSPPV